MAGAALKKIAIFGASSAMAVETARLFAAQGAELFLVARDAKKLDAIKHDLTARGAALVGTARVDLNETEKHQQLIDQALAVLGSLDGVLIAYGTLGNQEQGQATFALVQQEVMTNFLSPVSLLTLLANYFETQGRGVIAVITSVAGDRGRKSNYIYGSAKGALTLFLQGLRNRLSRSGVKVITIKPGFVDTPMTDHLRKGPLFAPASVVGEGIYKAMLRGRDVVYLPWFWRPIMLVVRHIPEAIFKRMSL